MKQKTLQEKCSDILGATRGERAPRGRVTAQRYEPNSRKVNNKLLDADVARRVASDLPGGVLRNGTRELPGGVLHWRNSECTTADVYARV